jgi:hypothetical protein
MLNSTRYRYGAQAALDMLSAGNVIGLQGIVAQAIILHLIWVLRALLGFENK